MKIEEIRQLNDGELVSRRTALDAEELNLRIQQQTGRLEKPSRLKELRRTRARIETVATERRQGRTVAKKAKKA